MISAIVAYSLNRVIGINGTIPWNLPSDLRRFRKLTMGAPIIMGRKTFDSILENRGHPLEGRRNIVLSNNPPKHAGCEYVSSWEEAKKRTAGTHSFVIGGSQIYELALPDVQKVYATQVYLECSGDAHFPSLPSTHWRITDRILCHRNPDKHHSVFLTLERTAPAR